MRKSRRCISITAKRQKYAFLYAAALFVCLCAVGFPLSHLLDSVSMSEEQALASYIENLRNIHVDFYHFREKEIDGLESERESGGPPRGKLTKIYAQAKNGPYRALLCAFENAEELEVWMFQEDSLFRNRYRWLNSAIVERGFGLYGWTNEEETSTVVAVAGVNTRGAVDSYRFADRTGNFLKKDFTEEFQLDLYLLEGSLKKSSLELLDEYDRPVNLWEYYPYQSFTYYPY